MVIYISLIEIKLLVLVFIVVHSGKLIQSVLHEKGKTVTWFARQLCCTRTNVYKIFQKENLDVNIIWRASYILQHDFFKDISNQLTKGVD